jgi:hypothetical protein
MRLTPTSFSISDSERLTDCRERSVRWAAAVRLPASIMATNVA